MSNKKTILITGASRGIGLLTAKKLMENGHHVIATMRDPHEKNKNNAQTLIDYAHTCQGSVEIVEMDITNERQVNETIGLLEDSVNIDVLINNAGIMPVGITEAYSPKAVRDCFETNVIGCINTNKALLPFMRQRQNGLLIYLSSTAGRLAIPYFGIYCASKWALEALAESMHYELATLGIESVIIEPSGHATDLIASPPTPDDSHCTSSYGEQARHPDKMKNMFKDLFSAKEAITDAQNVADNIAELVDMGSPRPLRVAVGMDMGVDEINRCSQPVQEKFIQSLQTIIEPKAETSHA